MKKAVITGAAGFIGRALTKRLRDHGVSVCAIDLPQYRNNILKDDGVFFLETDLTDAHLLAVDLEDIHADIFYHLAWKGVSTDVKNEVQTQLANIPLCLNVLAACKEAGCPRVVIPGSASEFAYSGAAVNGKSLYAPGDAYAASKAAAQVICRWYAAQSDIDLIWLLIGSIYGPGRNDNNILTYTIKTLLRGEKTAYSKLEQMWDYIYIDDLTEAMFLAGSRGKKGEVYPVGSGTAEPLSVYIKKIHAMLAPDAPLGIGLLPYKFGSKPDNSILDISNLASDTGFSPKVTFEEGISRTIEYFKGLK